MAGTRWQCYSAVHLRNNGWSLTSFQPFRAAFVTDFSLSWMFGGRGSLAWRRMRQSLIDWDLQWKLSGTEEQVELDQHEGLRSVSSWLPVMTRFIHMFTFLSLFWSWNVIRGLQERWRWFVHPVSSSRISFRIKVFDVHNEHLVLLSPAALCCMFL